MNSSSYEQRAHMHAIPIASQATRDVLEPLIRESKPQRVLEIGTAIGWSACRFAHCVAERGGQVISYEISYPSYHRARWRRGQNKCRNLMIYHADVLVRGPRLDRKQQFDFVFIDGMKSHYADYIHTVRPFCTHDAIIVCDDIRSQGNKMDALWTYLADEQLQYSVIDCADGDQVVVIREKEREIERK